MYLYGMLWVIGRIEKRLLYGSKDRAWMGVCTVMNIFHSSKFRKNKSSKVTWMTCRLKGILRPP